MSSSYQVAFVKSSDRGDEEEIPSGATEFDCYDDGTQVLLYNISVKM
jgi:hypothetical protein